LNVKCTECGNVETFAPVKWCCDCGGCWEQAENISFDHSMIKTKTWSVFRYGSLMELDFEKPYFDSGVGWTPIVSCRIDCRNVLLKLDYLTPTGSFKDRGVSVVVNSLYCQGVKGIVDDSSGNAGASLALFASAMGIKTDIFVPDYCSPAKIKQITCAGARVHLVARGRLEAGRMARQAVNRTHIYASHVYHPAFTTGQQTLAFELWEQLKGKMPDVIVCPVAQGGGLLGLWHGLEKLMSAGYINKIPRLIAVQTKQVSPLVEAFKANADEVKAVLPKFTIAEGVAVSNPVRGKRILEALRRLNGCAVAVEDEEILAAQKRLAQLGYWVELTSATVVAALIKYKYCFGKDENVMLYMTSHGLKSIEN